ncbi:MAG: L-seryl-tRNA(Sec) selenium transferase, partial [Acidimicrobiia bacterium]|nr:L-seryl-tRNA(Sec) selenium transferase [Acidimicrobiia bacterium]
MEMRNLPSVTELMASLEPAGWAREITANVARWAIDRARQAMQEGRTVDAVALATAELGRIGKTRPSRVINAGGVLLNTNLGRAPVPDQAVEAATAALGEYGNVEFDLGAGRRGGRGAYVHRLVADLTGAEAALVVNNNA